MIESYPKLHNLGHRETAGILDFPMQVEEKVDGSQFSFGVTVEGVVWARSKTQDLSIETPGNQFRLAVETVRALYTDLVPGYVYRGEFLGKPRHNVLAYDRVPRGYVVIFDVQDMNGAFLSASEREREAHRIALEVVPVLLVGTPTAKQLAALMTETTSFLGGPKIEGVVIKGANGELFGRDRMQAKYVSGAFREVAGQRHVKIPMENVFSPIAEKYGTTARWLKAVQRLTDDGRLVNGPKDIPLIIDEVRRDTMTEEGNAIIEDVWKLAQPKFMRGIVYGLGDWYIKRVNTELTEAT